MAGLGLTFFSVPTAWARPRAPMFFFCYSTVPMGTKYYVSRTQPVGATVSTGDLAESFKVFLAQRYGYPSSSGVLCPAQTSQASAEGARQNAMDNMRSHKYEVVETGWTYAAGTSAPAPAPAPTSAVQRVDFYYCETPATAQRVMYFGPLAPRRTVPQGDLQRSFAAYLEKKYGLRISTTCGYLDEEDVSAARDRQSEIDKYRRLGYTVVETDWTYTPVASAPAAARASSAAPAAIVSAPPRTPAAPVGGGPPSTYGVCNAISDPHTAYFSAPFKAATGDYGKWQQAFGGFLQKRYHYTANVGCTRFGSLAAAQSYLKKLDYAVRPTKKIVDTGWTYQ